MHVLALLRLAVPVLSLTFWPFSDLEIEAGADNYHVELDERYGIARTENIEVNLTYRGKPLVPKFSRSGKRSVGPLSDIYWNSRCIFAKHDGFVHIVGMVDEIRDYNFIIKRGSRRLQGPYSKKKFKSAARACGVRGQVPWMTVRQAYLWSLKTFPDQRWNVKFMAAKLVSTFWQGLLFLVLLFPVFLSLTIILYAIDHFRVKKWNVWPYFPVGWPVAAIGLSGLLFLNETVLLWR